MRMTIVAEGDTTIPPGYTSQDVEQCQALAKQFVHSLEGVQGHIGMSVVLTTLHTIVGTFDTDARFRCGQHLITVGANIANAAIDAGAIYRGEEKTAVAIAQQISNLLATERHGPAIDALLMVLLMLAKKFPCCTQVAADHAARVAKELATVAAMTAPPASKHAH